MARIFAAFIYQAISIIVDIVATDLSWNLDADTIFTKHPSGAGLVGSAAVGLLANTVKTVLSRSTVPIPVAAAVVLCTVTTFADATHRAVHPTGSTVAGILPDIGADSIAKNAIVAVFLREAGAVATEFILSTIAVHTAKVLLFRLALPRHQATNLPLRTVSVRLTVITALIHHPITIIVDAVTDLADRIAFTGAISQDIYPLGSSEAGVPIGLAVTATDRVEELRTDSRTRLADTHHIASTTLSVLGIVTVLSLRALETGKATTAL